MRIFHVLLCLACLCMVAACTTTYNVQMGAVTSFDFTNGSTCKDVQRDLGRPHQQVKGKSKGAVIWRYAYRAPSDKNKSMAYKQYTFVFSNGRLRKFSSKIESYNFAGKGFRGQLICPIKE